MRDLARSPQNTMKNSDCSRKHKKCSINKPLSHPKSISLMQKVSQRCFFRGRCLPYHGRRASFALSEKRKEVPLKTGGIMCGGTVGSGSTPAKSIRSVQGHQCREAVFSRPELVENECILLHFEICFIKFTHTPRLKSKTFKNTCTIP